MPRAPLPPPSASPPPPPPYFFLPVPHRAALTLAPGSLFDSNGTANKMNGALDHSDQPDPDAIKMFVGQIPRSWSEKELKELFEPYGAVYQINVLRDRSQNPPQSKGTDSGGARFGVPRGCGPPCASSRVSREGELQGGAIRCPCTPRPTGSSPCPRPPPGQVDRAGLGGRKGGAEGGGRGCSSVQARDCSPEVTF